MGRISQDGLEPQRAKRWRSCPRSPASAVDPTPARRLALALGSLAFTRTPHHTATMSPSATTATNGNAAASTNGNGTASSSRPTFAVKVRRSRSATSLRAEADHRARFATGWTRPDAQGRRHQCVSRSLSSPGSTGLLLEITWKLTCSSSLALAVDVVNAEQARIAEAAGACAVMVRPARPPSSSSSASS